VGALPRLTSRSRGPRVRPPRARGEAQGAVSSRIPLDHRPVNGRCRDRRIPVKMAVDEAATQRLAPTFRGYR
jgi:hypothetical protein